jgi:hypothetical protein
MLRSLVLIFALLLAMPAAAQAPGTVVKDCRVKGRRIFPSRGRSDFPTRLRRVVVV